MQLPLMHEIMQNYVVYGDFNMSGTLPNQKTTQSVGESIAY